MASAEQVALITGGSEPTAQAVARELIRRDWTVVITASNGQELESAAGELRRFAEAAEQVAHFPADLAASGDREALVEFVLEEFQRIDLAVSIPAGPEVNENLLEMNEQACGQVMRAYLIGPLFLMQLVANEMVRLTESGAVEAGKIVLVNSIGAYTSATERAARCLAGAATSMLTRLLADSLGEHGINVYEIRVGLISTGGTDEIRARYDRLIEEGLTPIRRWGRPQDIGLAVAAVAEDLLPYSTGEVINVDGGFHLKRL